MMNMRKLKNLPLLKTRISTFAMPTNEIEWLIAIQLVREHGRTHKVTVSHVGLNYSE
jgi:hypothetical protein